MSDPNKNPIRIKYAVLLVARGCEEFTINDIRAELKSNGLKAPVSTLQHTLQRLVADEELFMDGVDVKGVGRPLNVYSITPNGLNTSYAYDEMLQEIQAFSRSTRRARAAIEEENGPLMEVPPRPTPIQQVREPDLRPVEKVSAEVRMSNQLSLFSALRAC